MVIVMYQYIGLCICFQNVTERDGDDCDVPEGTIKENDKYFLVKQKMDWYSAMSYCEHQQAAIPKEITEAKVSFALAKSGSGLYRRRLVVL